MPAITGGSGKGGRIASIADKAARSVARHDADLVDSDIIAGANGICGFAETLDFSEIVPSPVDRNIHAVHLTASLEDYIRGPLGCACHKCVGGNR